MFTSYSRLCCVLVTLSVSTFCLEVHAQSNATIVLRPIQIIDPPVFVNGSISLSYDGSKAVVLKRQGEGAIVDVDDLGESPIRVDARCCALVTDSQLGGVYSILRTEKTKNGARLGDLEYYSDLDQLQAGNVAWRLTNITEGAHSQAYYLPNVDWFAIAINSMRISDFRSTVEVLRRNGERLGVVKVPGKVLGIEYDDGPTIYFFAKGDGNTILVQRALVDIQSLKLSHVENMLMFDAREFGWVHADVHNGHALGGNRRFRLRGTQNGDIRLYIEQILSQFSSDPNRMTFQGEEESVSSDEFFRANGTISWKIARLNQVAGWKDPSQFVFASMDNIGSPRVVRYPSFWNGRGDMGDLFLPLKKESLERFNVIDAVLHESGGVIALESGSHLVRRTDHVRADLVTFTIP